MTWFRFDDSAVDHPKIGGLSDRAFRWWVRGLSYASRFLTDGALPTIFWKQAPKQVRAELTNARLWDWDDPCFQIHDYLIHQSSRASVENERRRNRDRRAGDRGTTERRTAVRPDDLGDGRTAEKPPPENRDQRTDTEIREEPRPAHVVRFESWWSAYPKKTGKGAARKVWDKLRPSEALLIQMLDALKWQRTQPQWVKDGGSYIPNPSTYLTQRRWEDEPFFSTPAPVNGKSFTDEIDEWAKS